MPSVTKNACTVVVWPSVQKVIGYCDREILPALKAKHAKPDEALTICFFPGADSFPIVEMGNVRNSTPYKGEKKASDAGAMSDRSIVGRVGKRLTCDNRWKATISS
jgi:hypothetical protein